MYRLFRAPFRIIGFSLAFLLMVANPAVVSAQSGNDAAAMSEQEVTAAVSKFYDALNVMFEGDGQPMKDLWSRADDITYMGPNGLYLVGWSDVEKEWDTQAANRLGGKVVPQRIHLVVGADLAVLNCIESGENIVDGKVETVTLRSSTVFRKEGGAWKVIGHQTDLLGYMTNS